MRFTALLKTKTIVLLSAILCNSCLVESVYAKSLEKRFLWGFSLGYGSLKASGPETFYEKK